MSEESSVDWNANMDVVHHKHTPPMKNNGDFEKVIEEAEKKQFMLSLLLSGNSARFQSIYVYSSSLYHLKYQYLGDFTAVIPLREAEPDKLFFSIFIWLVQKTG
ncbi:hypothetical protein JTB14_009030 [Gonioctena quinquepunctata]|nr:hypothetical protein JTB14_009030 [Gonioctena quinquepunctata]